MAKIQINAHELQSVIYALQNMQSHDNAVSSTIIFESFDETEKRYGNDGVRVYAVSSYADCNDHLITVVIKDV